MRVLASIGNREGLRALHAFSDLHEDLLSREPAGASLDPELARTERLILIEVLQLLCRRAQVLTNADSVLIALADGREFVCCAVAGPSPIPPGTRLHQDSAFLRECLGSSQILRCGDSHADPRFEPYVARQLPFRSTVIAPLRGRDQRIGLLQAFSAAPHHFSDNEVRCLDLFAELVLAALKPSDQDRRFYWLSGVAGDLLRPGSVAEEPVPPVAVEEPLIAAELSVGTTAEVAANSARAAEPHEQIETPVAASDSFSPIAETAEPELVAQTQAQSADLAPAEPAPAEPAAIEPVVVEPAAIQSAAFEPPAAVPEVHTGADSPPMPALPLLEKSADAPAPTRHVPAAVSEEGIPLPVAEAREQAKSQEGFPSLAAEANDEAKNEEENPGLLAHLDLNHEPEPISFLESEELEPGQGWVHNTLFHLAARPRLALVSGLLVVVSLFSAGVWWGMQDHKNDYLALAATWKRSLGASAPVAAPLASNPDPSLTEDILLTPVPPDKLASLPKITGLRHWASSDGSTVVIDMEDQVNYEVHRLVSPDRIYFDLHDTSLPRDLQGKTVDVGDRSLSRVRIAQPVAGVTRVVLDTRNGANFSVSMETSPYRLVVDLREGPKSLLADRGRPSPAPSTAASALLSAPNQTPPLPARSGRFRIVLDAGHGGWDLGTIGHQGLMEKDLVLDVTRRLGKLLVSRNGAEVLFTRSGDDYIPLDERAYIANQAQADLFVSVHANHSSSATARGVETYYTNLFSAPGLKEVEKHPDGTFLQQAPVTLSADGLHEKIEESRRLATSVQHALYAALATKSPDIRDRGIKDASFVVLTGTTMPSILTEISFVSSPEDEQNLQSADYRQHIAEALYKGITRYQETTSKTKLAQLRPVAAGR